MTDDGTLQTPLWLLCNSPTGRLLNARHNEWLPDGARAARGGVAISDQGEVLGWVAYANTADDLAGASWPAQTASLSFDQLFPASAEVEIVYRGADWRRAVGSVNAHLARDCGVTGARVDDEQCELGYRAVTSRMARDAHTRARLEFRLRLAS